MLKKAASGVLAIVPCSRTRVRSARQKGCGLAGRTPRLREDMLFDHSPRLLTSMVSRAFTCHRKEIFNRPKHYKPSRVLRSSTVEPASGIGSTIPSLAKTTYKLGISLTEGKPRLSLLAKVPRKTTDHELPHSHPLKNLINCPYSFMVSLEPLGPLSPTLASRHLIQLTLPLLHFCGGSVL
jgi:hypothetical protein